MATKTNQPDTVEINKLYDIADKLEACKPTELPKVNLFHIFD
jgi:hypothetical protein